MSRRLNKKGGMELSVNSIIVIVISVIVLGFILSFISDAFKKTTVSVEAKLGQVDNPPVANVNDPITISPTKLVVYAGDVTPLKVSIYGGNYGLNGIKPFVVCNPFITESSGNNFHEKSIKANKAVQFDGFINIPSNMPAETYLCTLSYTSSTASEDLIVEIK